VISCQYGNPDGKTAIYFHGAPGSPEEASIFDEHAKKHNLNIVCYDRFSANASLENEAYYQHLAKVIIDSTPDNKVDIIGFSIGCHAAIKTSHYLQGHIGELHLISAAAPLDGTDFLDGVAGAMVFTLAMKHPVIFTLLSYWQTLLAKVAPGLLFKMLFASAQGEDKSLSQTAAFKDHINPVLVQCFNTNVKGYIREIKQYVSPWSKAIPQCTTDTYLWHGSHDNWSPLSMAKYLKDKLPNVKNLEVMEGLSHYTCLYAAAPKVCELLKEK